MASDYGLNFGFRRSDESLATREGRFKTPVGGTALLQGSAIEIDPAAPGYYKACGATPDKQTGLRGLLVQEDSHIGDIFSNSPDRGHDSYDLGTAKKDTLSVMWAGDGTKVWFRNSGAYSRGTRSKGAVTLVDLTGCAVGDFLAWDGAKFVKSTTPAKQWMVITQISLGSGVSDHYCEAVLTF